MSTEMLESPNQATVYVVEPEPAAQGIRESIEREWPTDASEPMTVHTATTPRLALAQLTESPSPVRAIVADMSTLLREHGVSDTANAARSEELSAAVRSLRNQFAHFRESISAPAFHMVAREKAWEHLIIVQTSRHGLDETIAKRDAMDAGADLWLSEASASTAALPAWLSMKTGSFVLKTAAAAARRPDATWPAPTFKALYSPFAPSSAEVPNAPDPVSRLGGAFTVPDGMLRSSTGRWDAKRMAEVMGVPLTDLAAALDLSYDTLKKNPDRDGAQAALAPVAGVLAMAWDELRADTDTATEERVRQWLRVRRPPLGDESPLDGILVRRQATRLRDWLAAIRLGEPE